MPRLRLRLRTLLVLVAVVALASAWGAYARLHRLADDRNQFDTHESVAAYQAFQESFFLRRAEEAERKAAEGIDEARWAEEAARLRARAAWHARTKREYEWRAELKRQGW